ncbi:MAG TPA: DUF3060 domain-containing protein [Kofleriaceae bacterium]|nr:DUF3060 domain-containing protein [Kofleriaceae bacterium]
MMRLALLSLLAAGAAAAEVNVNGNDGNHKLDCRKDPVVNFFGNHNTFRIAGACKQLNIGGNDNTITADSVAMITVAGNRNTITTTATDQVGLSGSTNTILWKRTIRAKAKPAVLDRGDHNTITQTK